MQPFLLRMTGLPGATAAGAERRRMQLTFPNYPPLPPDAPYPPGEQSSAGHLLLVGASLRWSPLNAALEG